MKRITEILCKTGIIAKMTVGATLVVALVGCGEENETQAPRNTGGGRLMLKPLLRKLWIWKHQLEVLELYCRQKK